MSSTHVIFTPPAVPVIPMLPQAPHCFAQIPAVAPAVPVALAPTYDPEFLRLKTDEQKFLSVLADPRFAPSGPYVGLVELDESARKSLLRDALKARQANVNNRDVQLRSIVSNCALGVPNFSNVSHDGQTVVSDERPAMFERMSSRGDDFKGLNPIFATRAHPPGPGGPMSPMFSVNLIPNFYLELPPHLAKHLILAGGSVVNALLDIWDTKIDYDLFIVGAEDPKQIVKDVLDHLKAQVKMVIRTNNAITLKMKTGQDVQIVLRANRTPCEVLMKFDLDAAGCCFHLGKFYATPRAVQALKTMTLNVDIDQMSIAYQGRLVKYMARKGFSVRIPVPITIEMLNQVLNWYPTFSQSKVRNVSLTLMSLLLLQMTYSADSKSLMSDYNGMTEKELEELSKDNLTGLKLFSNGGCFITGYSFRPIDGDMSPAWDITLIDPAVLKAAREVLKVTCPIARISKEFIFKIPLDIPVAKSGNFNPISTDWLCWAKNPF